MILLLFISHHFYAEKLRIIALIESGTLYVRFTGTLSMRFTGTLWMRLYIFVWRIF